MPVASMSAIAIAGSRPEQRQENMGPSGGGADATASGSLGPMPAPGDVPADRYRIGALLGSGGMATVHRSARRPARTAMSRSRSCCRTSPAIPSCARRLDREARAMAAVADAEPGRRSFDVDPGDPARS